MTVTPADLEDDGSIESGVLLDPLDRGDTSGQVGVSEGDNSFKILTVGTIELENSVIKTDTFANGASPIFGFGAEGDFDKATVEEFGYVPGTGETGTFARTQTATAVGNVIAQYSLGLGYLNTVTTTDSGYDWVAGKMFFHYSDIGHEPELTVKLGDIGTDLAAIDAAGRRRPAIQFYDVGDPIDYSDEELVFLRGKFGWDPTLLVKSETVTEDALSASMGPLAESLVTTYAASLSTFPRTRPLKLRNTDVVTITTVEASEAISPATTTADAAAATTTATSTRSSY
jgi:hypothetical protein